MFGLWDRYVVPPLITCACSSKPIMKQRAKIVPEAEGIVLEVGCGSGTNFALYDVDKVKHLHAIEPAEGMVKRARETWDDLAKETPCDILRCGAEGLPLEDHSVDTAVVTFVLCTIPDWKASLSELRRVLKPGGRLLFSEHGRAPDAGIAKWQRRIEPLWKRLAGGCHLTRDTREMLEAGGFEVESYETMYLPNTPKIAGFAAWGSARVA
ncbi:MAG: methyltransferase domain-containing protein [Pseudomonadota bacterium]